MSSHTPASNALHFIQKVYTYSDSTSMSPQNNKSDRSWSSCSFSTSSILLQLELSYLSDAAEDQNIAKAPSYRVLLSSLSFCLSPKILSLPQNYCSLLCPTSIFAIRCPSPLCRASFPPTVFSSYSFRLPLLHPEASPNHSAPFQSDSQVCRHIKQAPSMPAAMQNPLFSILFQKSKHLMQDQSKSSRHAANDLIRQRKLLP